MEYFCRKCGTRLIDFCCPSCGTKYKVKTRVVSVPHAGMLPDKNPQEIVTTLKKHEYISSGIWIIIGILQIVFFAFAIMGICNIIGAIASLIYAATQIRPYNYEVYEYYEKHLTYIAISAVANLIFGGIIGVIGCIYELYIRSYVLNNKHAFNKI